mmetsp:Transcript_10997/g.19867  ORF Transcript_10997/g.19867 Transcript_10997/m.19867 type:complete len:513 (+) Transcript_10997:84-1622(+)
MGTSGKRDQFFKGILDDNVKSVQWSVTHGGFSATHPFSPDEQLPPIHYAVQFGKLRALRTLLDSLDRTQQDSQTQTGVDFPDIHHHNRTALMLAAAGNWSDGVELLLSRGASLEVTDEKQRTARDYAKIKNRKQILVVLDKWKEEQEKRKNMPVEIVDDVQRKMMKMEMIAEDRGVSVEEILKEKKELEMSEKKRIDESNKEDERLENVRMDVGKNAVWNETRNCAENALCDLSKRDVMQWDHDVWKCEWLHTLTVVNDLKSQPLRTTPLTLDTSAEDNEEQESEQGSGAVEHSQILSEEMMNGGLGRLVQLRELTLRGLGLNGLPSVISSVQQLRVLDLCDNELQVLPEEVSSLIHLESLNVSGNQLKSLRCVGECEQLVSLKADRNQLKDLNDTNVTNWKRLATLSLKENLLEELPSGFGDLHALVELNVSGNRLVSLPAELGDLNAKRFLRLELDGNPIKDKKVFRILDKGAKPMKELLAHLKKQQKSNTSGNRKQKSKKNEVQESDSD